MGHAVAAAVSIGVWPCGASIPCTQARERRETMKTIHHLSEVKHAKRSNARGYTRIYMKPLRRALARAERRQVKLDLKRGAYA